MENNVLSLKEAQKIIAQQSRMLEGEHLALHEALGRVAAASLYALHPLPAFSQSLYDGVVIGKTPAIQEGKTLTYELAGEIPAGDIASRRCRKGQAFRIMTGAQIPEGGWQVVPQECCEIGDGKVVVSRDRLEGAGAYIRRKGGECRTGTLLVSSGECLTPSDIGKLADTGHDDIVVRRRPVVAYCCTGSELVGNSADSGGGLKVSSNRYLLGGMVRVNGANAQDWGSVDDKRRSFAGRLDRMLKQEPDFIMTTGGMGPGKYDLVEEIFDKMGGKIFFTEVGLRPGKSVLFGALGKSLFFGLPGPPSAVKALFQVLVRPALLAVQGVRSPVVDKAVLARNITLRRSTIPRLLEGVFLRKDGGVTVRLAENLERSECYILAPARRLQLKKGGRVRIYSEDTMPWLASGGYQRF